MDNYLLMYNCNLFLQIVKHLLTVLPNRNPDDIVIGYRKWNKDSVSRESLARFVNRNFTVPMNPPSNYQTGKPESVEKHINDLWKVLERKPDLPVAGSSLLPLPYSYLVPGGRFREIYYWDSYFTMLGLQQSGEWELMENMIRNFSYLIQTYGHIGGRWR